MKKSIQGADLIAPISDKDNKKVDLVTEDYEKGKQFLAENETAQAASFFHNALIGYEEKGDENGVANACNQLGNICLQRGEYEKALANYKRAWDICEKENDKLSLLALQKQLILVYCGLRQYDEAVSRCLDLLDQYSANNDPANGVATLEQLAEVYLEKGEPQKAADSYQMIASIHSGFKHKKIAKEFEEKARELMATN